MAGLHPQSLTRQFRQDQFRAFSSSNQYQVVTAQLTARHQLRCQTQHLRTVQTLQLAKTHNQFFV